MQMTSGVCDRCWGSGIEGEPWDSLGGYRGVVERAQKAEARAAELERERDKERARCREAAQTLLAALTLTAAVALDPSLPGARQAGADAPNYTPRITGMFDFTGDDVEIGLSILKANKIDPANTDRHYFFPSAPADGIGYGLTTYMGDGNPLPTFAGDPLLLPLAATAEETLELYWNALDDDNKISLAVKEISLDGSSSRVVIKNKYV